MNRETAFFFVVKRDPYPLPPPLSHPLLIKLCDNTSLLNEIKEQQKKKRILSLNIEARSCRDYLTGNLEWIFD